MENEFLVFQQFSDAAVADAVASVLKQNGIEFLLSNNHKILDPAYTNNALTVDISLQIKKDDFIKARTCLEEFYKTQVDNVDKDYYLFSFTDEELMDLVATSEEWGYFDYQLTLKILKDRGIEISPGVIDLLKSRRIKELTKPEYVHKYFLYLGYISAILGGLFGFIIGLAIAYHKKTLPNGRRIYAYRQQDRDHGIRMILLSFSGIFIWALLNWYLRAR